MKFKVLREHIGDKHYMPGDTREASEASVRHLIKSGVLKKAGRTPANKAAPKASNKASEKSA